MQVILLEKIQNLGDLGEEVQVKGGYARNFLIPQGRAVYASSDAKAKVEEARRELAIREAERVDGARIRMEDAIKHVTVGRLVVDDEGKLFGSVTNGDIAEAMRTESVEIARSEVQLPDGPLKQIGEYDIEVILHPEVSFSVKVTVEPEGKAPEYEESEPAGEDASEDASDDASDGADDATSEDADDGASTDV